MSVEQSEVQALSSVEFDPLCHLSVNLMLMVSVFACFVSMFQIVIWDYYQKSKSKKLTNLNETLDEAQITMDQEVWCNLCLPFLGG
jgi:predicted PolB exonuclease-like 3'-5' exonuclease